MAVAATQLNNTDMNGSKPYSEDAFKDEVNKSKIAIINSNQADSNFTNIKNVNIPPDFEKSRNFKADAADLASDVKDAGIKIITPRYAFPSVAFSIFKNRFVATPLFPMKELFAKLSSDNDILDNIGNSFKNIKYYFSYRFEKADTGPAISLGGGGFEYGTLENYAPKGANALKNKMIDAAKGLGLPQAFIDKLPQLKFTSSARSNANGDIHHYTRLFFVVREPSSKKDALGKVNDGIVSDLVENNTKALLIGMFGEENAKLLMNADKATDMVALATISGPGAALKGIKYLSLKGAKKLLKEKIIDNAELSIGLTYMTLETKGSGSPLNLTPTSGSVMQLDATEAVRNLYQKYLTVKSYANNSKAGILSDISIYKAQELETSKSIAKKFGISVKQFEKDNGVNSPGYHRVGRNFIIRNAKQIPENSLTPLNKDSIAYRLSSNGSPTKIARKLGIPLEKLLKDNDMKDIIFSNFKAGQVIIISEPPASIKDAD